ncbi:PepSY-associated TM helix domain-containing protein [Pyxidicoccus sp. MSG2]|uniref:PepSY-associated TM helix domain-containing protein n=1 Tax=Pyxidicoccus sp. MSG2 TaxID=2996790 RepID=UPI00226DAE48|nr:PepSY-associated TM helix domain-containing protein [Pyxidicoccus sp. MSG2]MCY1017464.1 PepSY-associated TM helix domain-containing protein [Pyxidicoccus sp. MSG2]
MKLSPRAYAILWDAHAWAGVLSSLVLFVTFFLGAFALFAEEMAPWQEPTFRAPIAVSEARAVQLAQQLADAEAPSRPAWFGLSLPTDEEPWLRIWRLSPEGPIRHTWLDPVSGRQLGERSDLGEFLNAMHFLEPLPGGTHVSGLASVVLVLLMGTGLLLQLGRLVREFVQFRPGAARRVFWSDAHKVIGVVSAPFLLVFALTGGILWVDDWFEPAVVKTSLAGDAKAKEQAVDWPSPPAASGRPAGAPDLARALALAKERFPESSHHWFFFDNLGDEHGIVHLPGEQAGTLHAFTHVRVSKAGAVIWAREAGGATAYTRVMDPLYGLHFATWAGFPAKVLYALLALLVSFGILAGNLLWLERRRVKQPGRFDWTLAKLTSGVCAGLPLAVAALFVANQLLPATLDSRPRWEHGVFLAAWGLAVGTAFVERSAARHARRLLVVSSVLLLAVPLIDAVRTGRLPFASGSSFVLATEVGLIALGLLLAGAARGIRRLQRTTPSTSPAAVDPDAPAPVPT